MTAIGGGFRNAFRNKGRAAVVVITVGIAQAVYLAAPTVERSVTRVMSSDSPMAPREDDVPEKRFRLSARVSSARPDAIRPVLERMLSPTALEPTEDGFTVRADLRGTSARDLNRALLTELRREERRTRLRAEWTSEGVTERFFDYVPKAVRKASSPSRR